MARVTLAQIAEQAGVSVGAVSYALNNKPGVSAATRARVVAVAQELGRFQNGSRRAHGLSTRADTIGLVLERPASMLGVEPFYMEFISGVEEVLSERGIALLFQVVPTTESEIATYEKWWIHGRVDGVLLVDLAQDDPRVPCVRRLGLPAVCVASTDANAVLPTVWVDDAAAVTEATRYLVRLGHRRIARVAGLASLAHTSLRDAAFAEVAGSIAGVDARIVSTDFSPEAGANAVRNLLSLADPPTAIMFDNDIMAVAALGVATEMGVRVPTELSLLAWDDSPVCAITHPALSAMKRDIPAFGAAAAALLLDTIAGEPLRHVQVARGMLHPRASLAAPLQ